MNKKDMFIREKLQEDKEISKDANQIFENFKEEFKMKDDEKKVIKISLGRFLAVAASFVIVILLGIGVYINKFKENNLSEPIKTNETETKQAFKYALKSNSLEDFDLRFLQLENEKINKIYSPLSIKYTLAMLNEGTDGESKEQISSLIGEYKSNKYVNSENMSFANALFVRDTYKQSIKSNFVNSLKDKYNADVIYDSFESAGQINSWVSDKTLDLIKNIINDSDVRELNYALVNALAIDMDWENKFLNPIDPQTQYAHENYGWQAPMQLLSNEFEGVENEVSGMGIIASVNNYDIVGTLGEENIRKTVGDEFRKYLNEDPDGNASYYLEGKDIETAVNDYLDEYIEQINKNYKSVYKNTDFLLYEDETVKAFAKDLKEYNGTTLQYVAIMPEEDLDSYINNVTAESVNKIIGNLKEIKSENFKEGVITQISGYIPKFEFDYELNLIEDLNDMGVKDVFDISKANLKDITDDEAYIGKVVHKANIEFTQDGIKASAATLGGGMGAGSMFDYIYDVPVEKIELNFNKPYMFIIRDKETGEVWFAGTVYEPLSLEEESESESATDPIISYSDFLEDIKVHISGDVNCDDKVDAKDVKLLEEYIAGTKTLTEQGKINADVNKDGKTNKKDVDALNKKISS